MNSYINLCKRFILDEKNKKIIDLETGEIFTDKDEIEELLNVLKKDKEVNRNIERTIRHVWGIKTKTDEYFLSWKKNSWFVKIYRTEMRKYLKTVNLSPHAGLLLIHIQHYIEHRTNKVVTPNNTNFTNKELQEMTGMGRDKLRDSLNELEEKLFIIRKGNGSAREIFFNPYLMCSGNEVLKDVIDLFDKAGYKPLTPY
jgi:hypothetical protein